MVVLPKEKFLNPSEVVKSLDLGKEDVAVDFGCGAGFWVIPMAKEVGKAGLVYAIDERDENLLITKDKADRLGLGNIEFYKAPYTAGQIGIKGKVNLILISNVLSLITNDAKLIASAEKLSKKGTKLVIIDWKKDSPILGKNIKKSTEEEVITMAEKAGFVFKKLLDTGSHHFGLYFEYQGDK